MNRDEKKKFLRHLLFAAAVILIYVLITNLHSLGVRIMGFFKLFSPLIIGVLFALILYKPMKGINGFFLFLKRKSRFKRHLPDRAIQTISLTLTFLLALLVLYFIANSVVPQIVLSFKSIFSSIENYYPAALAYLESLGLDTTEIELLIEKINLESIWNALTANADKIFNTAFGAVNGIATVLTTGVTAVIFSVYVLSNRETLKRQTGKVLLAYFKPKTAKKIRDIGMLVVTTFLNFISGQCLEAVILGCIFFFFMSIFGFPFATVISVIIALTAIIPYVGAFLGCAVGVVLIFMQDPMKALLFIGMFLVLQQLENNLIYPRVVGTSVNLPAIWTFTALIVGGALFGVVGMLFFIPLTSVFYTLLKNDVNHRIRKKAAGGGGALLPVERFFDADDGEKDDEADAAPTPSSDRGTTEMTTPAVSSELPAKATPTTPAVSSELPVTATPTTPAVSSGQDRKGGADGQREGRV